MYENFVGEIWQIQNLEVWDSDIAGVEGSTRCLGTIWILRMSQN